MQRTIFTLLLLAPTFLHAGDTDVSLHTRKRVETKPGSGRFHTVLDKVTWDAKHTAVIVCDMWDLHHCLNATRRGGEMAPRMNELLINARKRGMTIIHAPSECMAAYKDHPGRLRAMNTPKAKNLPKDISEWCRQIPAEEKGKYPIDQSDGGEDDDPKEHRVWADELKSKGRNPRAPWKSQMSTLKIENGDYISDSGVEVWSILDQRKIDQVILVGVHTNMCVLGRPFGLRQMAKNGKKVVLVRDMTDTMYNPERAPYVSHFTGTDLIIEHVEKWVCPTITSDQLLGGKPFRFAGDKRPHVVMLMGDDEYKTETTLPAFALAHLGKSFRVSEVHANETVRDDLPGLEVMQDADVAVISVRRRLLPAKKMAILREYVEKGKPIVAIRTSSHAWAARDGKVGKGVEAWKEFDADILGGNYAGHHPDGPKSVLTMTEAARKHPIFKDVKLDSFVGNGSLYKTRPLAKTTTLLLTGTIPDKEPEPIAWVNTTKAGGKVFYTSLGHWDDFKQPAFNRLMVNAIEWAVGK
jgi:nicotinamidase-related amidase/type 1 glutamine amidotransferase